MRVDPFSAVTFVFSLVSSRAGACFCKFNQGFFVGRSPRALLAGCISFEQTTANEGGTIGSFGLGRFLVTLCTNKGMQYVSPG